MTDKQLSPAAQAVLDAFTDEWPWQTMPDPSESIAAALRAAAEELQYRMFLPGNDPMVVDAEALFNLANELEAL
jgi:hypothetical protein